MSDTKFFTNKGENTLYSKFKGIFENNNIHFFDILVGYFRSSGYFKIRPYIENIENVRILVGINVDDILAKYQKEGSKLFKDVKKTKEYFFDRIKKDIQEAKYEKEVEDGIIQFVKDVVDGKLKIKAHPSKKIHAKIYIFKPENYNKDSFNGAVITGSSNLTEEGLEKNYEFNVLLKDYSDIKFASDEFEKLWEEGVEILPSDIENILKETYLENGVTPYDLFIKFLIEYFDDEIDYNDDIEFPEGFKKLSYQIDAINSGFKKLKEHNGFILADVVGLGKTVVATMVAKKFIQENGKNTNVLVVFPPALETNWKNTFKDFNIEKNTKFITNGSLDKILKEDINYCKADEYDLIIIDESHKFRNKGTNSYSNLQLICKTERKNKGKIEGGKKVMLISATPLNNSPEDIYNQLLLFQDKRYNTLGIKDLNSFFQKKIEKFKSLKKENEPLKIEDANEVYEDIKRQVIQPLVVRRTRRDLQEIKQYSEDLKEQGITFPNQKPPEKIEYILEKELNELFYDTLNILTDDQQGLKYSRYKAISQLKAEYKKKYENADRLSMNLAGIMKNGLIKRLESSFEAFKLSLNNLKDSTQRMIEWFDNGKIYIAPDLKINELLKKGEDEDTIQEKIEKLREEGKNNNDIYRRQDFEDGFYKLLKEDLEKLEELCKNWEKIDFDPKIEEFLKILDTKLFDKKINKEKKLVIFTESKRTSEYIAEKINRKDVLVISSENRKDKEKTIKENFDANSKEKDQKNDYNIIISTDVLAEGINLHRANIIVNYDTPWNSTKLMQRIGRVNRIGTKADTIYNYVFYPSNQGDKELKLKHISHLKLQSFHNLFSEDSQIYSEQEIITKDNINKLDLDSIKVEEEINEELLYLEKIRNFKKEKKEEFERIFKIDLKSRVGRKTQDLGLKGSTIAFIKRGKIKEYLYIKNNIIQRKTALQTMKIFEADINEKGYDIPKEHYKHIEECKKEFENIILEDSKIDPIKGVKYKVVEKKLKDFLTAPNVNKEIINKLLDLLRIGVINDLDKEVETVFKKQDNIYNINKELVKLSDKYKNIHYNKNQEDIKDIHKTDIIISETFLE